jgi:hypothetical protein
MHSQQDVRSESALYWTAVSLIVCEGMPVEQAAERLGVGGDDLRSLLERRQAQCPYADESPPEIAARIARTH